MEFPVTVEGFEGHKLSLTAQGLLFSPKLLVDGHPAPKGRKGGQFVLRRNDGTEAIAQIRDSVLGLDPAPQLFVDGKRIHVAEPLKLYQWLWSAVPLFLLFIGGGLGGLCGAICTCHHTARENARLGTHGYWQRHGGEFSVLSVETVGH